MVRGLLVGPGQVRGPAARRTVHALIAAGAVLLAWSGVIHLRLWSQGYQSIPVIGPLFLAQGVGTLVIAAVLVAVRRLAVMAVGAVTLAATSGGLLLSAHLRLFGYRESLAVPDVRTSLYVECTGTAILLLAAGLTLGAARGGGGAGR